MRKILSLTLALLMALMLVTPLAGCQAEQSDIVVIYTNDVHCGIEDNIGYAGLAAYVNTVREQTEYVTLVDCGDAIQGDYIGTVSKGTYIVDIMNELGYDLAVLGNHEFDYGMEQISQLIEQSDATYLGCNLTYSGSGENALSEVKPYEIISYGKTQVAYIGVSTPHSVTSSTPTYFMEDGEYVYGFTAGNDGQDLYDCVQGYIDECLEKGADYVVLLTHLGDDDTVSAYSSTALLRNTTGVDVCLDAHAHSVIPCRVEQNKDGQDVILSSTGTKLANIGQLVISADGTVTTTLISGYTQQDDATVSFVSTIQASYEAELETVVASSDIALSCTDANGVRLVRNRETTIGNLCADAYRAVTGADVALVNGGGIRADLPEGDITYADMLRVHPYGNLLCVVEVTGQEILDCLEYAYRYVQAEASADGVALGESGGFQHVSGLKLTIDTSIPSPIVLDENGQFLEISGQRRVKDVLIQGSDGTYSPIDPEATYTLASHNYLIKSGGDGNTIFMDNTLLMDEGILDYQAIITYITETLGGQLGDLYAETEGRITVE